MRNYRNLFHVPDAINVRTLTSLTCRNIILFLSLSLSLSLFLALWREGTDSRLILICILREFWLNPETWLVFLSYTKSPQVFFVIQVAYVENTKDGDGYR